MPEKPYKYDVFISYSHKDGDWVTQTLVPRLEAGGLKVCIDERDFIPGKAALLNMQDGIGGSRRILLVLSPHWVESRWTQFEAELARTDDPDGVKARTIPLLWRRCTLPEYLAVLTYVDFTRKQTLDLAWWTLLKNLGVPEEKIRAPKKVHPGRHARRQRRRPKGLDQKGKNLLRFSLLGLFIVTVSVLATIWAVASANLGRVPSPSAAAQTTGPATDAPSPTDTLPPPSETPTVTITPAQSGAATATLDPACISAQIWTAFTTDKKYESFESESGCWRLSDWGIALYAGQFSFLDSAFSRGEKYGLSRSIPPNSVIEFTLKVSYLRDTEIWMGIAETTDPAHDGVFFVRQASGFFDVRSVDETGRVFLISNDNEIAPVNSQYAVKIVLAGERMAIYVNGLLWSLGNISAPYQFPRFYLGYQSAPNGMVNARISVPVVTENTPR